MGRRHTKPALQVVEWGGDTHNQYNNEEWGYGSWKEYPEGQSNGRDAVPLGSGWDDVPYEEPCSSTELPLPRISHATGWDDVPHVKPTGSTKV